MPMLAENDCTFMGSLDTGAIGSSVVSFEFLHQLDANNVVYTSKTICHELIQLLMKTL
jgi:hypothetical protein